jgi:hypothetical protein
MSRVVVDCSRFPLVIQTMHFGYTLEEMEQALTRYLPLFARGQPFAIAVWNEPGAATLDAPMRAMVGRFQRANEDAIRRTNLTTAIVMPEFSYRAALTALNWLSPPVSPHKACASIIEAVEHCCDVLTRHGIALTPGIVMLKDDLRRKMGYVGTTRPGDSP